MNNTASPAVMPLWKKILLAVAALILLLLISSVALLRISGAWSVFFPSHEHDTVAPDIPASLAGPALLLFTKTNSFRHVEGIAAGTELLQQIAQQRGWSVFHTENGAVFNPGDLQRFSAVVFLNASGDTLSVQQQLDFQAWLEQGGGWLGVHAAGDGSHVDWPWYLENLIGANFTAHIMGPQFQFARVDVEDASHAAMQDLPASWEHKEEWYSWAESPREKGFHILATIDETSYSPWQNFFGQQRDLRMGDHPVVWARCIGRGRTIYSAMGHAAESFQAAEHRLLLENALSWVMGEAGQRCQ